MASTPEEVTARFNELAVFTARLEARIDDQAVRLQFLKAMIEELKQSTERQTDNLGRIIDAIERSLSQHRRETT